MLIWNCNTREHLRAFKSRADPLEINEVLYIGLEHIERDTGKLLAYGNSKDVRSLKARFSSGHLLYGKLGPYLNKVHAANFDLMASTQWTINRM